MPTSPSAASGTAPWRRARDEWSGSVRIAGWRARPTRCLVNGTPTIEAKTGYGLDLTHEAKSFEVLRQLAARLPLRIVPTFLGAHVVPPATDRAAYLRALTEEMLPTFKAQAIFC